MIYSITKLLFTIFIFMTGTFSVSAQLFVSPDAVKTTAIKAGELKTLVKSPEKQKPVLINFWATWCGPCRVEFPDLVEIDKDYREKGLNFVLISVDDFALIDTRVPEFLEEYEATMPSYLIDYPTRPEIAKAVRQIAPNFRDIYPLTLLFNAKGKLVYQKAGVVNSKILRKEIDKVLPKENK